MSKIAIFFGEGFEEIEALTVVDLCRRAGMDIQMVSINGDTVVTGSHNITVGMDAKIEEIDFSVLDMIILPGGMPGTKNLEAHVGLMEKLDTFYEEGKYIAAICAAPSIFGHRGYLKGRKACCFPGFENELEGAMVTMDSVTQDGHVITSRGMGTAMDFGLKIVEVFGGKELAEQKSTSILYRL